MANTIGLSQQDISFNEKYIRHQADLRKFYDEKKVPLEEYVQEIFDMHCWFIVGLSPSARALKLLEG